MQCAFFPTSQTASIEKKKKKRNSCSSMNMHCHKSSIFAPVRHGQLLQHPQNIHPSIFHIFSRVLWGDASKTRWCLKIMQTNGFPAHNSNLASLRRRFRNPLARPSRLTRKSHRDAMPLLRSETPGEAEQRGFEIAQKNGHVLSRDRGNAPKGEVKLIEQTICWPHSVGPNPSDPMPLVPGINAVCWITTMGSDFETKPLDGVPVQFLRYWFDCISWSTFQKVPTYPTVTFARDASSRCGSTSDEQMYFHGGNSTKAKSLAWRTLLFAASIHANLWFGIHQQFQEEKKGAERSLREVGKMDVRGFWGSWVEPDAEQGSLVPWPGAKRYAAFFCSAGFLNVIKSIASFAYGRGPQNCASDGFAVAPLAKIQMVNHRHNTGIVPVTSLWRASCPHAPSALPALYDPRRELRDMETEATKGSWRHLGESGIFRGPPRNQFNPSCQLLGFSDTMYSWWHQHCSERMTQHAEIAVVLWKLATSTRLRHSHLVNLPQVSYSATTASAVGPKYLWRLKQNSIWGADSAPMEPRFLSFILKIHSNTLPKCYCYKIIPLPGGHLI